MRLYILVEGQTEDDFVKHLLGPHLSDFDIHTVVPIIAETSRDSSGRKRKGGGYWKNWKADLDRLTSQQRGENVRFTTMFDLYGLPKISLSCKSTTV